MEELDLKKTRYFVIAIIVLILLGVILIVHFNNKELVSGEHDDNKITESISNQTTTKITTTKKVKVNKTVREDEKVEVEKLVETEEKVIYKSTIDDNKLVFNYKLSSEINDADKIISTKLSVSEIILDNIIGLYDISLYDDSLNKKSVINSLINIKIPMTNELVGYDEYKVIYITDKKEISEEKFDVKVSDDYLEFSTTHLSLFAIIGIKNQVIEEEIIEDKDLSSVSIDVSLNDEIIEDTNNMLVEKDDKFGIKVNDIKYEYSIYYALKSGENVQEYKLYSDKFLNEIGNGNKYTLLIKVVVDENTFKVFEVGNISVYDIVYLYDKDVVLEKEEEIGVIYNEDGTIYKNENGTDYLYNEKDINKDIVIDVKEEMSEKVESSDISNDSDIDINNDNSITNNIELDRGNDSETLDNIDDTNDNVNNNIDNSENEQYDEVLDDVENKAAIKVNGNIYLVEKTDISKLEMTGHLIIDTSEDITFDYKKNKLLISNLYSITIRNKEFSLNGVKYTYEYINNTLVIKKVVEDVEISKEEFEDLFNDLKIVDSNDNLVLEKKETVSNVTLEESFTE